MTTIAVRAGVMASDSRATYESATGGHRVGPCTKLYRKCGDILGTAGEVPPALVFLDWYGKPASKAPEELRLGKAECTVLVLRKDGVVLLYEGSCYAEPYGPQFDYTEDDSVDWASGFAVLTFIEGGALVPPEVCTVIGERAWFRGQPVL